ncbi:HNH endonuclease [Novosphingobium sp. JCM 18896]|uniref:HNH endonuclease n=1 Tax=Novosphingobium sp. JCM 18896 TaxID=2989731 RepID=UPI002222B430|nr:HNH endonuclease [Novosphingobium sp. JCM 18896]MCW1431371.1 HNH endonuclease [Novosphingobium sp. JCM 18896]
MAILPIREKQFQTANFAAWLTANGGEVGVPTNRYEVIRYRAFWNGGSKAATHIVYCKDSGLLTYTGASAEHYRAFINGVFMPVNVKEAERQSGNLKAKANRIQKPAKIRQKLRERDGRDCWFCGVEMTPFEETIEHLIPKSDEGTNSLSNLVLAHQPCNQRAGSLSLAEKIALRAELRASKTEQPA